MACPSCQECKDSGAKFCIKCGARVRENCDPSHVTYCPSCFKGKTWMNMPLKNNRFCPSCGRKTKEWRVPHEKICCLYCKFYRIQGYRYCQACGQRLNDKYNGSRQDLQCPSCPKELLPPDTSPVPLQRHYYEQSFFCPRCGKKTSEMLYHHSPSIPTMPIGDA